MKKYLSLIKFSHTIFALPFALVGFFLGLEDQPIYPIWLLLLKVLACMIFARSAAMAFNRYADRLQDARNPRTAVREIPSGTITSENALIFTLVNSVLFMVTAYLINPLCFYLSPLALLVILGYSYTKRFTFLCHLVLGLGLSLAPVGAYLAVTAQFALVPVLLGVAVLFWVSGFDIIYSLQDELFDRAQNLKSIPVWIGGRKALYVSRVFHVICALVILAALWLASQRYPSLEILSILAGIMFVFMLGYQHRLVRHDDLSKVNLAFFTTNGVASVAFALLVIGDLLL